MSNGMFKIFLGCVSNNQRPRRTTSFPENLVEINPRERVDVWPRNHSTNAPPTSVVAVNNRIDGNGAMPNRRHGKFSVTTVTNRGKTVRGSLEVTESEIILRRHRHGDVRWPLQYVRRYGHEPGVFSFESGRRCESGPGVFTFRSPHAEELFHLIQQNIQESATSQFGAAVPPVIFERNRLTALANRYVENSAQNSNTSHSAGFSPTQNVQAGSLSRHRLSLQSSDTLSVQAGIADEGDYLRPNSALRREMGGRHFSAEDALIGTDFSATQPRAGSGSDESNPHALIDIQPHRGHRPISLTLPPESPPADTAAPVPGFSSQYTVSNPSYSPIADNVFLSPRENSEQEATPTPSDNLDLPSTGPYINVHFGNESKAENWKTPNYHLRRQSLSETTRTRKDSQYLEVFDVTRSLSGRSSPCHGYLRHHSVPEGSSETRLNVISPYVNLNEKSRLSPRGSLNQISPSELHCSKLDYVTLSVGSGTSTLPPSPCPARFDPKVEIVPSPVPPGHMIVSGGSLDRNSLLSSGYLRHRKTDSWGSSVSPRIGSSRPMPEIMEISPQSSNYALIDSAKTCALKYTSREPLGPHTTVSTSNNRRIRHESSA